MAAKKSLTTKKPAKKVAAKKVAPVEKAKAPPRKVAKKKTPAKKAPAKKTPKAPAKKATKAGIFRAKAASVSELKKGVHTNLSDDRAKKLSLLKVQADKGGYHLVSAEESDTSYYLRRPFGITSLDLKLKGGLPAGTPCVISGPDGAGKDLLLWMLCAEQQRLHGDDFAAMIYLTEFKMDKAFMKDICGFQVGFTDTEIQELNELREKTGLPPLTEEEEAHYKHQVGHVELIEPPNAEKGFNAVVDGLNLGIFHIIAVNSLGNLDTSAKQKAEDFEDFAQQASSATLLAKFMPRCKSALNAPLRDIDGHVMLDDNDKPRRNETLLVFTDQVRSDREAPTNTKDKRERTKYKSANGSWALRHDKAIELQIHMGAKIRENNAESKFSLVGTERDYEVVKGKFGVHEGIRGSFPVINGIGVDRALDLLRVALDCGVIQRAGAYYSYDGQRVQGEANAVKWLRDDLTFFEVRDSCFEAHEILYRHV